MFGFVSSKVHTSFIFAFSITSLSMFSTFWLKLFTNSSNSFRLTFSSINYIIWLTFLSNSTTSYILAFFYTRISKSSLLILLFKALWISLRFDFLLKRLKISFSWDLTDSLTSSLYSTNLLEMSSWHAFSAP
jgi:hypothetical protein